MLKKIIRKEIILILFIIILQFLVINEAIPINNIFNDKFIGTFDYPMHYYHASTFKAILFNQNIDGFDTSNKTIKDIIWTRDEKLNFYTGLIVQTDKVINLFTSLLFFIPILYVYKIYVFLLLLLLPVIIYYSAKNFNIDKKMAFLSSILFIFLCEFSFWFAGYLRFGMYGYFTSLVITIFTVSYLYKNKLTINTIIIFIGLSIITVLFHLLASFPLIIMSIIVMLLKSYKINELIKSFKKTYNKKIIFIFILFFIILFNSFLFFQTGKNFMNTYKPAIDMGSNVEGFKQIKYDINRRPIQTIFLFLSILSIIYLYNNNRSFSKFFLISELTFFLLGYFGSYIHIMSYIKPYRFNALLLILTIFPISLAINHLIKNKKNINKYLIWLFIIFIIILSYSSFAIKNQNDYGKTLSFLKETRALRMGFPEHTQRLVDWMNNNTNDNEKFLFEGSIKQFGPNKYLYGDLGLIMYLIPMHTNNTIIAYSEFSSLGVKFSNFKKPMLFQEGKFDGKNISQIKNQEIKQYLDKYNVSYIIVWSNESRKYFDNMNSSIRKTFIKRAKIKEAFLKSKYYSQLRNQVKGLYVYEYKKDN